MKYSPIILMIAAMLPLPCTNLLAQIQMDSVVFKNFSCKPWDGCTDKNFTFISTFNMNLGTDTVSMKGYENVYTCLRCYDATLEVELKYGVISLCHYKWNKTWYDSKGNINFYTYEASLRNIDSKKIGNNYVLQNPIDTLPYIQIELKGWFYPFGPGDGSSPGLDCHCGSKIDFSDTTSVTFFTTLPNTVSNITLEHFTVQPNPSSTTITIKNIPSRNIEIFDLLGRKRLTQSSSGMTETSIDVSMLPVGLYWVRVGAQIEKIIIARE